MSRLVGDGSEFVLTGRKFDVPKFEVPEGWKLFGGTIYKKIVGRDLKGRVEAMLMRYEDGKWQADEPKVMTAKEYDDWVEEQL